MIKDFDNWNEKKKQIHHQIDVPLHNKKRIAILSQMRLFSAKRLVRRTGKISDNLFKALNKSMSDFINKTDSLRSPRVPNGNK